MTLDDKDAIISVLVRYATGIDQRDWSLFETCFTADLTADYGSIGRFANRDTLVQFMTEGHKKVGRTLHRLTNFVVKGNEHSVWSRCYIDALLLPLSQDGSIRRAHGWYDDTFVRCNSDWRIKTRHFVSLLQTD